MKYSSWRGIEGINEAFGIQQYLWNKLGKKPSKKDFIAEGYYKVYMALYRNRRSGKHIEDPYSKLTEITNLLNKIDDPNFIKKVFEMCINKLTPDRAQYILDKITGRFN